MAHDLKHLEGRCFTGFQYQAGAVFEAAHFLADNPDFMVVSMTLTLTEDNTWDLNLVWEVI